MNLKLYIMTASAWHIYRLAILSHPFHVERFAAQIVQEDAIRVVKHRIEERNVGPVLLTSL
jgi:uncharacterized membrane protein YidH (DUF202 family)